jgi:hypothetical protein
MRSPRRTSIYAFASLYAVVSGAVGAALLFAGLSFWSLVIAFAVLVALVVTTGVRDRTADTLGLLSAFSFAFVLFAWPIEFLVAAGLWGHWE